LLILSFAFLHDDDDDDDDADKHNNNNNNNNFETLSSTNSSAVSFFQDFGCRISQVSGDSREASYLFQRIAVTTQRFNSILFRDSFVARESQDDSDS